MPDIVVCEFMDEAAVDGLRADFDVLYDPTLVDRPVELIDALLPARGLIVRNRTQVREKLLVAAPQLKVVGRLGVGLDNIDVEACRSRGINVYPATGANDLSVAEYVITASLMLLRGAWLSSGDMLAGHWPRGRLMGRELCGRTMGLVGFGSIAREVATRAKALGMAVAASDPYVPADSSVWDGVTRMSLDELLATADVVSLHVPLLDETRHLISAGAIARMRPDAVLINAARGGVVDEAALAAALREGRLAGAALDVFETEPLTREAAAVFAGAPHLILTPHIAGVTQESNVRVSELIARRVRDALLASPG
jgi:(S)-sulfolactate dehydrogenase